MFFCVISLALGVWTSDGLPKDRLNDLPTSPPKEYVSVVPCHDQLGRIWAPAGVFESMTGTGKPMLGFYDNKLVSMIFYLSDRHLYPRRGSRWTFGADVNATVDSITVAPAEFWPYRERRAYEITMMIHHDPPVVVDCDVRGGGRANPLPEVGNEEGKGSRREKPIKNPNDSHN